MRPVGISSNKEFRKVFRKICGNTKERVDQKTAYQILSCCGKTIVQSHLIAEWPLHTKKISVDRLFEIFVRLGDLCIEDYELEIMKKRKIKVDEVLDVIGENSLINSIAVEDTLRDFLDSDGFINIQKLINTTQTTRDDLLDKLLLNQTSSNKNQENENKEQKEESESEPESEKESETKSERQFKIIEQIEKADEIYGDFRPLSLQVRGSLAISPKLQSISFNAVVDEPIDCEVILSLTPNSDVPPGHFDNDLFLLIYDQNEQILGISKFWLNEGRYSTGNMIITNNSEFMVIGMGTTFIKRKSTRERLTLIEKDGKLSKRFRMTLMNIFESFDVNQDGVLSKEELNFYTQASGDDPLTDEEWNLYYENFDNRDNGITMEGFLKMHQVEASDQSDHVVSDLWHSLNCLGYDSELQSIYGCSYNISIYSEKSIELKPKLHFVSREDRNFILEKLFNIGVEQSDCVLKPRLFQADYFGLMIVRKQEEFFKKRFKLETDKTKNVRWNFPHSQNEEINFQDSDSEWVLIASYTTINKVYDLNIRLIEIEKENQ